MDTALFSPSSLFNDSDNEDKNSCSTEQRTHAFPGMELVIREFSFHELNANLLWPGTFAFAEWLIQNKSLFQGRRILELGSGTGALAIFLQKSFGIDITTSDFDDEEVEENIAYNCRVNGLPVLPHIRHSWGDTFPTTEPDWDLVIASDILLYVKQYPNLIRTISFLLKSYKQRDERVCPESFQAKKSVTLSGKDMGLPWPAFLMSWRRRIGKEEETLFFSGCQDAGLRAEHLGSRVYCISPLQETNSG